MWIQSIVLEYHCDITILWLYIVHYLSVDDQITGRNLLKTCDHTKCCRFTTSRWSYEDDKLFICNIQIEIFYCLKSVWINFANVL